MTERFVVEVFKVEKVPTNHNVFGFGPDELKTAFVFNNGCFSFAATMLGLARRHDDVA